jgi:hypothetical protein
MFLWKKTINAAVDYFRGQTSIEDMLARICIKGFSGVVACGSRQGRSVFAPTGVAALRRGLRKRENAALGRKMPFSEDIHMSNTTVASHPFVVWLTSIWW